MEGAPSVGDEPMSWLRTCVVRGVVYGDPTCLHACSSSRSELFWVSRSLLRALRWLYICCAQNCDQFRMYTVGTYERVSDVWMSSVHALSCTRPCRLGILQCSTKHTLRRLQKSTNIMLRDIHVYLICTPVLPHKALLDTHKYTDDEQHRIECCHHIEWTSWTRAIEQGTSRLGEQ